jgi:hypothetical protein
VNSIVTATGSNGAGIGSGVADGGRFTGSSIVRDIVIRKSRVTASGSDGAGIGPGKARFPLAVSEVARIVITEGTVSATGANGPGIGSGNATLGGLADTHAVVIDSATLTVRCSSGAGVGGRTVTMSGDVAVIARTQADAPAIDASSIVLSNVSLSVSASGTRVFGSSPVAHGMPGVLLLYENVSAPDEPLTGLGVPVLHIGNVKLEISAVWQLCAVGSEGSRCFPFNSSQFTGYGISLNRAGTYRINASAGAVTGRLERPGQGTDFAVSGHSFFPNAQFVKDEAESHNTRLYFIIGGAVGAVVIIALVVALCILCRRRRARQLAAVDSAIISGEDGRYTETTGRPGRSRDSL